MLLNHPRLCKAEFDKSYKHRRGAPPQRCAGGTKHERGCLVVRTSPSGVLDYSSDSRLLAAPEVKGVEQIVKRRRVRRHVRIALRRGGVGIVIAAACRER